MIMFGTDIQSVDSPLRKAEVTELYKRIVQTEPDVEAKIRQLRIAYQVAPKQYTELKKTLPYVVCGVFNPPYRKTENFGYTEHLILDIDHLSSKGLVVGELKTRLQTDSRILMLFSSPSEDGLKVMFRLRERCYDANIFSLFYKEFLRQFSTLYHLEQVADKRTSDVTRACFLSVDREAYFNSECEPVDMNLYINPTDPLALFELASKQKKESEIVDAEESYDVSADPNKEVMERIKQCLNPNDKPVRERNTVFVPEQLDMIMDDLKAFVECTGLVVSEIINIQYGKKIRISMGLKQAEINLFYGRRGFSVVKSPRSGTSEELNELTAQLIQTFICPL